MNNVFVSGATGYIGELLTKTLADNGRTVVALVRDPQKMGLLQHPNVRPASGTLSDAGQLARALEGCSEAYHIAALAGVWHPDPEAFRKINVRGTLNLLEAARQADVRRVVITSTAGVMGASPDGRMVDETTNPEPDLTTEYERSKLEAEREAFAFGSRHGLEVVVANPSRVYGPGQWSESNGVTKMIKGYAAGRWRMIPGDGNSIGNYAFVGDVVQGHLLAMEKGTPGQRYILGGENASFNEFFALCAELTGRRHTMFHLPLPVMLAFAHTQQFLADTFGRKPLITPPFVRKFLRNWPLSSQKAQTELGYRPLTLEAGIRQTLEWLSETGV